MRLYHQLVLFMLAAVVGPVAILGFALLGHAERELRARIDLQQRSAAQAAAALASRDVEEAVEALTRMGGSVRFDALAEAERAGALRLLASQSRHFAAAVLVDARGAELSPAVAGGSPPRDLAPFRAALPVAELSAAAPGTVAMSDTWLRADARAAALAVRVRGDAILAVEFTLAALQERAQAGTGAEAQLWFFDRATDRVLAAPSPAQLGEGVPAGAVAAAVEGRAAAWRAGGAQPALAAAAPIPGRPGWFALVVAPEAAALAPVARMRTTVLGTLAGAFALLILLGFAFTRRVAGRIEAVAQAARELGRGNLGRRAPVAGTDEVADLAGAFNAMGGELEAARRKLETWNEELQRKVEERTAELKAAQAQLLEAQKLAAIGQLGAGVAHEINNPLAGILGNAQLLLLDRPAGDRDAAMLRKIEAQARRAKEITANLLRFSQQRPQADFKPVDLGKLVRETLTLVETQIHAEGIELALDLAGGAPVRGDAGHLAQVLLNLVANARAAMLQSPTKRLTLSTRVEGAQGVLAVSDTGKGIAEKDLPRIFEPFFTTKDVWANVGLGLSVSFRIVEEHGGKIEVATAAGKGSTFTVRLPLAAGA